MPLPTLFRRKENAVPETAPTAVWPEGVLARYQTLADATVDLTHTTESGDHKFTVAQCTGCTQKTSHGWANWYQGAHNVVHFQDQSQGDREARLWAQSHAETCRAMPRPTA